MTYQFRPAIREQCFTLTGFAGPSGSGKTYSALRFAMGLANGGKIAMIDTEARRGLHYADQFEYLYSELTSPFTPERYIEAIQAAEKAGATVIIVDSMSHEHEGPGGVLEMHDSELTRMAGDDFRKREACKFAAWIKPKAAHNRFVNTVLQVKAHLIFCFRAKEKLKLVKNQRGKMEPVAMGWQPICTDRLEYEMTALLMLPPGSNGVPELRECATKLQEQHRAIFDTSNHIDQPMGKSLADWASGGQAPASTANGHDPAPTPFDEAKAAAEQGKQAFLDWWNGPGKTKRAPLRERLKELQEIAAAADDAESEDPFVIGPGGEEGEDPAPKPDAGPTSYSLTNWDGEVSQDLHAGQFTDAFDKAIKAAPDINSLVALQKDHKDALDRLKRDGEQGPGWHAELMEAAKARYAELSAPRTGDERQGTTV